MATRTRFERCQWCSNQLAVPIHVQITACPVCRRTNRLAPATNTGNYQQQPPPRPAMYNGFSQQPSRLPSYSHQQSIHPHENTNNTPPPMYNNGFGRRPTANYENGYNSASSGESDDDAPVLTMNNDGGYNNHVSPRPTNNSSGNGGYNRQVRIPHVNDNRSYNNGNQVLPGPMNNGGYNGYHHQQAAPPNNHVLRTPPKVEKKRAVLCGISYMNTPHSLDGSVTDVESVKRLLIDTMGFSNSSIIVLTEVEPNPMCIPTSKNIIASLRWLVEGCQPGDSLVFYYTGHGSRVADDDDDEYDGYDEALCPLDYKTAGKLLDDQLNELIVRPLPKGVQLHTIIDTCYSGSALDLCYISRSNSRGKYFWEDHEKTNGAYQGTNGGLAVCISACDDHQKSGNTTAFTGNATGALTYSLVKALGSEPTSTYGRLMNNMRTEISSVQSGLGLSTSNASASAQEPQLSSSEKFDIYSKKIVL